MAHIASQLSVHKLVKTAKALTKESTHITGWTVGRVCTGRHGQNVKSTEAVLVRHMAFKNALFGLDVYAYKPELVTATFSTFVSLAMSFAVIALFLFSVAYTTVLWAIVPLSISQGETAHDNSSWLIAPSQMKTGMMPLPRAGVFIMMDDGSAPADTRIVRHTWQQSVICSGGAFQKKSDPIPSIPCSFHSAEDGTLRTNATTCADWDKAVLNLKALNNTAADPCGVGDGDGYDVPRIAGTFYNPEYAYVMATASVNATLLQNASFASNLFKGSVQLYLQFPYTGSSSLAQGHWPDGQQVVWSRRVNLLANAMMKWEVSLRVRQVDASSHFWDIPQLESEALDYTVEFSEVSIATGAAPGRDGFQEVARVYLKLDDRDMKVTMSPYATAFSLFSDWGGFLSMLMAMGVPAMLYNQAIFRRTVEDLMKRGDIAFDEELRKSRSKAIATSFATAMRNKETQARRRSVLQFASMYDGTSTEGGPDYLISAHRADMGSITNAGTAGVVNSGNSVTAGGRRAPRVRLAGESPVLPVIGSSSILKSNRVAPALTAEPAPEPPPARQRQSSQRVSPAHSPDAAVMQHRSVAPQQSSTELAQSLTTQGDEAEVSRAAGLRPQSPALQLPGTADDGPAMTVIASVHRDDAQKAAQLRAPASGGNDDKAEPGIRSLHSAWTAAPEVQQQSAGGPQPVAESVQQPSNPATLPPLEAAAGSAVQPSPGTAASDTSASARQPHLSPATQSGAGAVPMSLPSSPLMAHGPAKSKPQSAKPPLPHRGSYLASQTSGHRRTSSEYGYGDGNMSAISGRVSDEDGEGSQRSFYEAPQATGTASILVKYHHDIFEDSDQDENDFDDVIRHCTSECHALYHLRQVVKLVQHERSFLTCGIERYQTVTEESRRRASPGTAAPISTRGSKEPLPHRGSNEELQGQALPSAQAV